jgi:hypothetical protein
MNVVQLITIFQMGVPSEDVPPLKLLNSKNVNHFDSQGCNLSRMKRFMKLIKILAARNGVWKPPSSWHYLNGKTVMMLWEGIWDDLQLYLLTEIQMKHGRPPLHHKSRSASLSWRTSHNKRVSKGVYKAFGIGND